MSARDEALVLIDTLTAEGVEDLDAYGKGSSGIGGPGEWGVSAWAPTGRVWVATGTHGLNVSAPTAREFWPLLLADLRAGLESCNVPDCEGCDPAGDNAGD